MVEFDLQHVVVATGRNVSCSGLYFVESVFLAKNVPRHAVRMTFLDGKNYGTNSTVFSTSFLSFFLKTSNVMGNSLRLTMNQMDRHVSVVIVLYFEILQPLAMFVSSKSHMSTDDMILFWNWSSLRIAEACACNDGRQQQRRKHPLSHQPQRPLPSNHLHPRCCGAGLRFLIGDRRTRQRMQPNATTMAFG